MTAVASPPIDALLQPAPEKMYAARRSQLVLVLKPEYPVRGPSGEQVDIKPGVRIQFKDGILRVPLEGKMKTAQGRDVDTADVLAFLEKHTLYGDPHEGFTEIPQVAPPASEQELTAITMAAASLDDGTLQQLLDTEQSGWNRPQLVGAIKRAMETIESIRRDVEAQAEAEAKKPAAKK
jgi:hypothetical protein